MTTTRSFLGDGPPPVRYAPIVAAVLVAALQHPACPAERAYNATYAGNLLVVVDGPADEIRRVARELATHPRLRNEGRVPSKLFDFEAVDEQCLTARTAARGSRKVRAVFVLPSEAPRARATARGAGDGWEEAHKRLQDAGGRALDSDVMRSFSARGLHVEVIEPDLEWEDRALERFAETLPAEELAPASRTHVVSAGIDKHWPADDTVDWYLDRSQLAEADRLLEDGLAPERVAIAHLDTGYTGCPDGGLPPGLRRDESYDFSAMTCPGNCVPADGAQEPNEAPGIRNKGHGTGTLGILAGGPVDIVRDGQTLYRGPLGGASFAKVVEYRIANFVAVWRPSRVGYALHWANTHDVDVVSMSMGGPPNFTLHQVVNEAYCRGTAMFTAAGNNFTAPFVLFSTPRTTVFPARYSRVVAVVGVTHADRPYTRAAWSWDYLLHPFHTIMRGNAGPAFVMKEALAAYTPNVAWLEFQPDTGCGRHAVRLNGAGTSAATPQVAAAAAQWLQYYGFNHPNQFLVDHWRSWQKSEAVYEALFARASKKPCGADGRGPLGQGIVQAADAIRYGVPKGVSIRPAAELDWEWLASALISSGPAVREPIDERTTLHNMVATEISQLAETSPRLAEVLATIDPHEEIADRRLRRRILEALSDEDQASPTLRTLATQLLHDEAGQ